MLDSVDPVWNWSIFTHLICVTKPYQVYLWNLPIIP